MNYCPKSEDKAEHFEGEVFFYQNLGEGDNCPVIVPTALDSVMNLPSMCSPAFSVCNVAYYITQHKQIKHILMLMYLKVRWGPKKSKSRASEKDYLSKIIDPKSPKFESTIQQLLNESNLSCWINKISLWKNCDVCPIF